MSMLVGKNPNYDGPKTHRAIIRLIHHKLTKEKNRTISAKRIDKIVRLFFGSGMGVGYYMRKRRSFGITGIGRFEVKEKVMHEEMVKSRKRNERNRELIRKRVARYRARNPGY